MEKISSLIRPIEKKASRKTERGELLTYFMENANADRKAPYKPLPISFYAVKLAHLKVPDLYYLKSICEDARNRGQEWSKVFWGSLKT